jgi:hypothetical protein
MNLAFTRKKDLYRYANNSTLHSYSHPYSFKNVPDPNFPGPRSARLNLRAYKSGPNLAQTEDNTAQPELSQNYVFFKLEPGLARCSGSKIRPKPGLTCKPVLAWFGIFGPGQAGPGCPWPAVCATLSMYLYLHGKEMVTYDVHISGPTPQESKTRGAGARAQGLIQIAKTFL